MSRKKGAISQFSPQRTRWKYSMAASETFLNDSWYVPLAFLCPFLHPVATIGDMLAGALADILDSENKGNTPASAPNGFLPFVKNIETS